MKITKIYLDMDGVLCDFEKRYVGLYNEFPKAARERKLFSENWHNFVKTKQFEKLDYFPGALRLMKYVNSLNIPVEILSSSGGKTYHSEVESQKINWLKAHNIHYKPNIVDGRRAKAKYATPTTVLIDDTPEVIKFFEDADGIGILHKNFEDTKNILDLYLTRD
jgi:5'(3')-deoxyribonucleotidase